MAKLTVVDAARVTGISRSQLYRYIKAGKLSRPPEGLIDTAELLRAGLMRQVPTVPPTVPETHDATVPSVSPAALDMISFTYMRSEADRVLRTLQLLLSCSSP
jgi:hypothetical protein